MSCSGGLMPQIEQFLAYVYLRPFSLFFLLSTLALSLFLCSNAAIWKLMSGMEWNGQQQQQQTWHKKAGGSQKSAYSDEKTMKEKPYSGEREGRGSRSWSCSWRGATRCEWRQSRVQMNAHLKLSPNPFTIDAVQSGRYLPHAAHCCTRMCPCQQDEQPIPNLFPSLLLLFLLLCSFSFFFLGYGNMFVFVRA